MAPPYAVIPSSEPLSSYLTPVAAKSMIGGVSKYSAITCSRTALPKPFCLGCITGGPPCSCQRKTKS